MKKRILALSFVSVSNVFGMGGAPEQVDPAVLKIAKVNLGQRAGTSQGTTAEITGVTITDNGRVAPNGSINFQGTHCSMSVAQREDGSFSVTVRGGLASIIRFPADSNCKIFENTMECSAGGAGRVNFKFNAKTKKIGMYYLYGSDGWTCLLQ